VKFLVLIAVLFASFTPRLVAGTRIYEVSAPAEMPSSDEFTVIVSASPMDKGNNRAVAIEYPAGCQIIRAYAVATSGGDEIFELPKEPEATSLFSSEKNREASCYRDASGAYAGEGKAVVYYFVFSAPPTATKAMFRVALLERTDPYSQEPPAKDKKAKKKQKPLGPNWRMVNPAKGSDLRFGKDHNENLTAEISFVSGWSENSRALHLAGEKGAEATLQIIPDSLQNFFGHSFSMSFWFRTTVPEQEMLSFIGTGDTISVRLNSFGELALTRPDTDSRKDILASPYFANDGAWHHCILSRTKNNYVRLFYDGECVDSASMDAAELRNVRTIILGKKGEKEDLYLDELRLWRGQVENSGQFLPRATVTARDTMKNLFALFHFEEFGRVARSTIFLHEIKPDNPKPVFFPVFFQLDTNAEMTYSSSPLLLEEAVLSVDRTTPTKLLFSWRASREYNIKAYELERRIATFGEYKKVLRIEAKKHISPRNKEAVYLGRTNYSASENLPHIANDINLYYRLALIGEDSSRRYTVPVTVEYGEAKDVFVEQNKPNPFNPKTTIPFMVRKSGWVKVAIYDIIGREVLVLQDGKLETGKHSIEVDGTNWPAGIYFYKVKTQRATVTKRMVLVK
jgi:hypothetical protein